MDSIYKLLTEEQFARLRDNGRKSREYQAKDWLFDPVPVVKLFTPDAGATWLLSEIDPDDMDLAFGLCDLGVGCPELGYVSLQELAQVRGRLRLPIEKDDHFIGCKRLSVYADEARANGRIMT